MAGWRSLRQSRQLVRVLVALQLNVALIAAALTPLAAQSTGQIYYVYDNLGRLVGVVDQQGNAAQYNYDAVGNILSIERFNASDIPGDVGITLVSPNKGRIGTRVQIFGKGFSATPSQNTITFNDTPAAVLEASPIRLLTTVPSGATTGPLVVTTPLGTASASFTVLEGTITVSPSTDTIAAGQGRLFTATVTGLDDPRVTWSVNGISGGNAVVGTITDSGLYIAPTQVPSPAQVTIRATSVAQPSVFGEALVTITANPSHFAVTSAISVRFGPSPPGSVGSPGVSVFFGTSPPGTLPSAPVTVQFGPQPSGTVQSDEVSVTRGPVVTAVNPLSATQGTIDLALTVEGVNLSGATALTFLRNGAIDTTLQASGLTVNADGTQLTATVTINSSAPLGARVVRIVTPNGASTNFDTGTNLLTVTAP